MAKTATLARILTAVMLVSPVATGRAPAQETAPAPALLVELNNLQPTEKGCRFTFVVANRLGAELSKASLELAVFDQAGFVERLTVLDFKDLPDGKTKVSRFDIPGADCAKISRILVNDVTECTGQGIDTALCRRNLRTAAKTAVAFGT